MNIQPGPGLPLLSCACWHGDVLCLPVNLQYVEQARGPATKPRSMLCGKATRKHTMARDVAIAGIVRFPSLFVSPDFLSPLDWTTSYHSSSAFLSVLQEINCYHEGSLLCFSLGSCLRFHILSRHKGSCWPCQSPSDHCPRRKGQRYVGGAYTFVYLDQTSLDKLRLPRNATTTQHTCISTIEPTIGIGLERMYETVSNIRFGSRG